MSLKFNYKCTVIGVVCLGMFFKGAGCDESYETNNIARSLDAKDILTSIATNIMARGFGTTGAGSQVISLNLTNLIILILLKALIFAAGSLGTGHFKGGYARSLDGEEKFMTDEEILMFLSYLTGSPGNNGCLQHIACKQPLQARKYANAGEILLKTAKMFQYHPNDNYDYILREVNHAANVGYTGGNCQIFQCNNNSNNNVSSN